MTHPQSAIDGAPIVQFTDELPIFLSQLSFNLSLPAMEERSFTVQLPLFEGPFDLLLFFIERDELDIYDIPIAKLTDDFLNYLHRLETLDVDVASEFILVAATLMKIKSRMLLPRPSFDERNQEIDPRDELVKHLLEYRKYKSVIDHLRQMEEAQLSKAKRGNLAQELKSLAAAVHVEAELQDVDAYKLLMVFERVLKRREEEVKRTVHEVIQYPYTVEGQKQTILEKLTASDGVPFLSLFDEARTRIVLIFNFLAILELLAAGLIKIRIGEGYNNFWLIKPSETPSFALPAH